MSDELEVLKEAARRLDEAGIAYMITGSIAANFYAVPRMTREKGSLSPLLRTDFEPAARKRILRALEKV